MHLKKRGTMDIILILIGVFLLIFTVYILHVFRKTGMEPSTLITCVFAACTGECGFMAIIKREKERNKSDAEVLNEEDITKYD